MGTERDDLDLFDLDLDFDDDDTSSDDRIPKTRVQEIVKKRLEQERKKTVPVLDKVSKFKEVYGVDLDEAIRFAEAEKSKQRQPQVLQTPQQPGGVTGVASGTAVPPQAPPLDPVTAKLIEIDNWRRQMTEQAQREREAVEFVSKYPDVKFEDIPKEVLERRQRGGVTLAEAYELVMGDKRAAEAAKRAAEAATKNYRSREFSRTEGPDFSGGAPDDTGSLTDEERKFASMYGMSPKEYVKYKVIVKQSKEGA